MAINRSNRRVWICYVLLIVCRYSDDSLAQSVHGEKTCAAGAFRKNRSPVAAGRAYLQLGDLKNAGAYFAMPSGVEHFESCSKIRKHLVGMPAQSWRLGLAAVELKLGEEERAVQTIRTAIQRENYSSDVRDAVRDDENLRGSERIQQLARLKFRLWIDVGWGWRAAHIGIANENWFPVNDVKVWLVGYDANGKQVSWASTDRELTTHKWLTNDVTDNKNDISLGYHKIVTGDTVRVMATIECREGRIEDYTVWTKD